MGHLDAGVSIALACGGRWRWGRQPERVTETLACEGRWRMRDAGVGKAARIGSMMLAIPLRWRMRDAGVGEGSQNRLRMTLAFSLRWRRADTGARMRARTGHPDAGVGRALALGRELEWVTLHWRFHCAGV
jgi:hypothetical protein